MLSFYQFLRLAAYQFYLVICFVENFEPKECSMIAVIVRMLIREFSGALNLHGRSYRVQANHFLSKRQVLVHNTPLVWKKIHFSFCFRLVNDVYVLLVSSLKLSQFKEPPNFKDLL